MNNNKKIRHGSINIVKLRELRREKGWTQAELDKAADVGYRTTANAEAGLNITVATLRAFARVFRVHPAYFLD